jgi:rhodanese-related sulfurtransferase
MAGAGIVPYGRLASWMLLINYSAKGEKKMRSFKSALILFLAVGLVTWMAAPAGALLDNKFEKEVEKEAGAVKLVREVQRGGYDLVTTEELKQWMDSRKDMLIVNTMPYEDSYKKQHVPGAVQFLFPIPDMKEWDTKETDGKRLEDFKKLLGDNKDKPIVIYCGFVKCTRSHNGAAWAVKLGYNNVYRYPGGIFAWKGADFPVEKTE